MNVVTFQLLQAQHQKYLRTKLQTNDASVREAVHSMIAEEIAPHLSEAQQAQFFALTEKDTAAAWFAELKERVTPFPLMTEGALKKRFKKEKKLKLPKQLLTAHVVYLAWDDPTQMKRFIVHDEQAIVGVLEKNITKGICALCHEQRDTLLYTVKTKSGTDGQYTKNSQYICADSYACNAAITDESRIRTFMMHMQEQ